MYAVWLIFELCVLSLLIAGWFYNIYFVFTGKSKDKQEFFWRLFGIPAIPVGMLIGTFTLIF